MPEYREKNEIESMQASLGYQGYPVPWYASSLPVSDSTPSGRSSFVASPRQTAAAISADLAAVP